MVDIYYFGALNELGHHLRSPDGKMVSKDEGNNIPWMRGYDIDGRLAPKGTERTEPQGLSLIHHRGGWTAISFWDRTIDHRYGSHSTYVAKGDFDFEQMVELAKLHFADRWSKMKFDVKQAVI